MAGRIIDYTLNSNTVSNPDGTFPATVLNCVLTTGPGNTVAGNFSQALDFGASGRLQVNVPAAKYNATKFCIRTVFKIDTAVTARQNLVESNALPFSFFLDKGNGTNDFTAVVSVAPKFYGWSGTTTGFFIDLKLATWYVADLVYDTDTVAVFINGVIQSVHAFPNGLIEKWNNNGLFIGTWVDGARSHFNGCMAALQIFDDIPLELETQLDERRSHAEWFISYKYESIKTTLNFGQPVEKYKFDYAADSFIQLYNNGIIMYNSGIGTAFEMHGAIWQYYLNQANKAKLGYLVSDEGNAARPGSRKNIFRKGGIYWSGGTGAVQVDGQIFLDYELMNEAASPMGLPVSAATSINNGREQLFQGGRMYHKNGQPKAHEVHGAILARFLQAGGVNRFGYPTSNESDVNRNGSVIGKFSDFEGCTIYWSGSTGAWDVYGDIREKYRNLNGPLGNMGFPTSGEENIPGASAPARCNTFQNGSILWFGNWDSMFVCYPFKVFLGRVDTQESEGFAMGQNDLYMRAIIDNNGHELFRKRFPNTGDFGGHNVVEINQTLPFTVIPNDINQNIRFTLDVWESDSGAPFGGGDDFIGTYRKTLNMSNAWGMRENNGVFNSGAVQKIKSITWSVQPQVNESSLSEIQKWWGVKNQGTPVISKQNFAAAFRDVDSDPEWWDATDWLEKAFYELVAKGVAAGGNCFGMSLEGIYARKHRSLFSLPIDRFTNWNSVVNEFNIRHQYQVGAEAIWWFVGQFLSGNTHDPVDVFNETMNCYMRGDNPVLCISQNWDFSGAPHCIMPVGWSKSGNNWKMKIMDPNFPGVEKELTVDASKNEFTYVSSSSRIYKGTEWSGGRMHYMPYCVLNERPRTPIWDAILLLLAGTIIILGDDAATESLTDENGIDLNAFGADAVARLKAGKGIANKFVSVKGFDVTKKATKKTITIPPSRRFLFKPATKGVLASEMYLRHEIESQFDIVRPGLFERGIVSNITFTELMTNRNIAGRLSNIASNGNLFNMLKDREPKYILNDKKLLGSLDAASKSLLESLFTLNPLGKDVVHKMRGIRDGSFKYAVKNKLNEFMISSAMKLAETNNISSKDLGTNSSEISISSSQNKTFQIEIENKLGVKNDRVRIIVDKIPLSTGKDAKLNLKPGIAGIDIITNGEIVPAQVQVITTVNGKTNSSRFKVDIEGGIRLRPSTILTNNELKVGKIDTLYGQLINSKTIKGS